VATVVLLGFLQAFFLHPSNGVTPSNSTGVNSAGRSQKGRFSSMKRVKSCLSFMVFLLFWWQGNGLAETMYVTDQLYLSLRRAPDPEQPAMTLLPSDTKVEVLTQEGDWAQVKLEDGRTGWVLKRFLGKDLPKALLIEELTRQIESKDAILERLQNENTPVENKNSERTAFEEQEKILLARIETLKNQTNKQRKRLEVTTKEDTERRLKDVYVTGIAALFVGLIIGYLLSKPRKKRQLFS
jgi:SH3 domain protein